MDIVWFAEIKWDYLKTRKQQIITRKPDDVRLLYLEPYVKGRSNRFDLRKEGNIFLTTIPFVKPVPNPVIRAVLDRAWVRALVDRIAHSRVKRFISEAGFALGDAGLILSNINAIHVAEKTAGRFLLYDCNDAHGDFPGMPRWTGDYVQQTCRAADHVFATSQALFDDVAAIRGGEKGCEFLGNGVDYGHFESMRQKDGTPDPPSPPRIGYLGAIAPWFNFEFVADLAGAHPEWEIELVGPVILGVEDEVTRLTRVPNVTVRPPVPYDEVPRVMSRFSVGIIPFRYDSLTRGVNPNKMYEYLAMGLPVVASRFSAEVQKYPDQVLAPKTSAEFVLACEDFVAKTGDQSRLADFREKAYEVASRHDWRVVAESFWRRVKEFAGE